MSPLLERVLADVDRLDAQERLQVIAHVATGLQQKDNDQELTTVSSGGKRQGFGLWKGSINIHDDFDEPLSDFEEYM